MVDPLGAAVGLTSLVIQVAEDIIKGYQLSNSFLGLATKF